MYKKLYRCFQAYIHVVDVSRKMKFYHCNFGAMGVCLSSRTDAY